jgi:hypothetical protein
VLHAQHFLGQRLSQLFERLPLAKGLDLPFPCLRYQHPLYVFFPVFALIILIVTEFLLLIFPLLMLIMMFLLQLLERPQFQQIVLQPHAAQLHQSPQRLRPRVVRIQRVIQHCRQEQSNVLRQRFSKRLEHILQLQFGFKLLLF